jgi:hypothetical protein
MRMIRPWRNGKDIARKRANGGIRKLTKPKPAKTDRCAACGRKFGEVVFRFDQSDTCTACQRYESSDMKRSREYDRTMANRIHVRF